MDLLLLSTVFVCLLASVVGAALLWKIAQSPPLDMLTLARIGRNRRRTQNPSFEPRALQRARATR